MHAPPLLWLIRLLWLSLPVTAGELLADAVATRSDPVQLTVAGLAWLAWLAGLAAAFVPMPATLVVLRVLAPGALGAAVVAAATGEPEDVAALGWLGVVSLVVVAVAVCLAEVGAEYLNAAAYGDERRFPLRPPAVLLLGPIPLLWAAMTLLPVLGALLVASQQWVGGALALLAGAGATHLGIRSFARLTRRWMVFVPAGVTLVDELALVEPTLMRRGDVVAIGPAPVGSEALDLTVGATGLLVQVDLASTQRFTPVVPRGRTAAPVEVASVLVAPSRPGAMLRHATEHELRVTTVRRG